jgi:serine protease Do
VTGLQEPWVMVLPKSPGTPAPTGQEDTMARTRLTGLIAAVTIAAAACSSVQAATPPDTDSGRPTTTADAGTMVPGRDATTTTTTATTTQLPEDTAPPRGARPARRLEDVEQAVVQIVANGTFATPDGELVNVPGSGSGFVIDGSGLAVTNNHVVTGAAYLDVYVAGEDRPRNAQIVGVSECSDLAVIDIDGEFGHYLEWHENGVGEGLGVFVAGFPLGDPQYTLYDGIIAKAQSEGHSSWASIHDEIEHTADSMPGNSGGPIVTRDGGVVGVHYASGSHGRAYGIGLTEAQRIVEQLAAGHDVTSIGINGEAFATDDGFSGIWVSSVQSGTPAAEAGVRPGDVVTRLENLVLATDGTMADYCNILRSRGAGDELSIEVLRLETGEVLEGVLNRSELEATGSIAAPETDGNGTEGSGTQAGSVEDDPSVQQFVTVRHTNGGQTMEVPAEWTDVEVGAWTIDGEWVGRRIAAAPDMDAWRDTWSTPGAQFRASAILVDRHTPATLLDTLPEWTNCTYDGRFDYDDGMYRGVYDQWSDCGSGNGTFYALAAVSVDGSHIVLVEVVETSEADSDVTMHVFGTFMVEGAV